MLSEEEKQAINYLKECVIKENLFEEDFILYNIKILLNLITKLQKENEEKDNRVRKIINRLDNDYKRITETKTNKSTFPNYLDDYTRCRLKAYRTKTREIKEYIEQEYFENKAKEKGE